MRMEFKGYDRFGVEFSLDDQEAFAAAHRDKVINKTRVEFGGAKIEVSTVNLIVDHAYGDGPPLHFETMLFSDLEGDPLAHACTRTSTLAEAIYQHEQAVADLRSGLIPEWARW